MIRPNLDLTLESAQYVLFDLETTGLFRFEGKQANKIIQVGAVLLNYDGEVQDTFESFVNPNREIPWEAFEIHGIDDSMVTNSPSAVEVLKELLEFMKKGDVVFAFNAPFDVRFLVHEWILNKTEIPHIDVFDVKRLASRAGHSGATLSELTSDYDITNEEEHRALSDSLASGHVLLELLKAGYQRSDTLRTVKLSHDLYNPVFSTTKQKRLIDERNKQNLEKARAAQGSLGGRTGVYLAATPICITGSIQGVKRSDVKKRLKAVNYYYVSEVREDIEFMVVGSRPTARKMEAAAKLDTPLLDADRFVPWLLAREKMLEEGKITALSGWK